MRLHHLLMMGLLGGCMGDPTTAGGDDPFSSARASLMDFEFDGELTSATGTNLSGLVRGQLMYTLGQLNGEPGVSRLSKLQLSGVASTWNNGLYRVRYHAKLPVAWGDKSHLR